MWVPFSSVPDAFGHATAPLLLSASYLFSREVAGSCPDDGKGLKFGVARPSVVCCEMQHSSAVKVMLSGISLVIKVSLVVYLVY